MAQVKLGGMAAGGDDPPGPPDTPSDLTGIVPDVGDDSSLLQFVVTLLLIEWQIFLFQGKPILLISC